MKNLNAIVENIKIYVRKQHERVINLKILNTQILSTNILNRLEKSYELYMDEINLKSLLLSLSDPDYEYISNPHHKSNELIFKDTLYNLILLIWPYDLC